MSVKLSEAFVKSAEPNGKWADSDCTGLYLAMKNGKGRFVFKYRNVAGTQKEYTISATQNMKVNDARIEAGRLRERVRAGEDPQGARTEAKKAAKLPGHDVPRVDTFGDILDQYLIIKGPFLKETTLTEVTRAVNLHLKPILGHYAPLEMSRLLVQQKYNETTTAKTYGRKIFEWGGTVWNWAIKKEILEKTNPFSDMDYKGKVVPRERSLSIDEFKSLGKVLQCYRNRQSGKGAFNQAVIDLIYFYLFTNLRRSEAKRLEWWQVGEQYITVHIHKNDKKHGKPLSVVITDEIRELLKVMKSRGDSRWMFPSNQHGGREHINYFDTFWKRILREAGIENFHVHDLRKTFSAVAGHKELNIRDNIIGALMGHTPSGVTAIHYPHIDEAEKIEAAGKITKRIAMLLNASD